MSSEHLETIRRNMLRNPRPVLEAARKGSPSEITVLSNAWTEAPGITPDAASDIFLHHLQAHLVPKSIDEKFTDQVNCAFASVLGLSKIGPFLQGRTDLVQRIQAAWKEIYQWSVYLFASRIESLPTTDVRRKACLDVLAACWYALCHQDRIREAMVSTPATVELATRMWLEEDSGPMPNYLDGPVGTCVLGNILRGAGSKELDRVLKIAGKAENIAKRAIKKLQAALKQFKPNPAHLTMYLDFVNSIARVPEHPLRSALLAGNIIWIVTNALVKISIFVNTSSDVAFLDAMVAGFGFLSNCIESTDGFTWVSQAVGAGLLHAFVDSSPKFSKVDPEDRQWVVMLIDKILPRYLVYRTVIESVDESIVKLKETQKRRVEASMAKDSWNRFFQLAQERSFILGQSHNMKAARKTCDNVKCQKVPSSTDEVRRCSACLTTFYCSKECQVIAWKEGDHRTTCKLKQQERMEGRAETIPKKDVAFSHHLALWDGYANLEHFKSLASKHFPNEPRHSLVISLDYTKYPAKLSVKPLDTFTTGPTQAGAALIARNDALIERVQTNRENYTLIESRVSCGQGIQCVLTLATAKFWDSEGGPSDLDEEMSMLQDLESMKPILRDLLFKTLGIPQKLE